MVSSVVLLIVLVRVTMTMVRGLRGIHRVMAIALVIRGRRLGGSHLCLDPGIPTVACGGERGLVHRPFLKLRDSPAWVTLRPRNGKSLRHWGKGLKIASI